VLKRIAKLFGKRVGMGKDGGMNNETGYFLDAQKRIVGPAGLTSFQLSEDEELFAEGKMTDVYVEDGQFYRCRKKFWFFGCCSRTGHELTKTGKILGNARKLPWA